MRIITCVLILLVLSLDTVAQRQDKVPYKVSHDRAEQIVSKVLRTTPIIDGHNDLYRYFLNCKECPRKIEEFPLNSETKGNTDIPKYRRGGVGGQLYNVYGKDRNMTSLIEAFDLMHRLENAYPDDLRIVGSSSEMRSTIKQRKIAILPMLEGSVLLQNNFALLRMYYRMGLRSVTFAYQTNDLADGSDDAPKHNGISELGRRMVSEMNRLGVIIDLSHISAASMRDILKTSKAPVLFSHSNAYELCKVNRNVPDDVLRALKENRGIVMVNFVPFFVSQKHADWLKAAETAWKIKFAETKDEKLADRYYEDVWLKANPEPQVNVSDVADHFDHIRKVIGVDYIGIGADYYEDAEYKIKELSDASAYPKLLIELARRGWMEHELKKITNENFLRVFEEVERKAAVLSKTTPPTLNTELTK